MARRGRKQKNREATNGGEQHDEAPRTNSDLTEDERHALHLRHCCEYEIALAAKKKADAEIKNVGKRIKAEDDSVAKVKKTLRARTPEGEAELRAEMEQTLEVLRWAGVDVGETADMFPTDRTPAVDRAVGEGKRAGLRGEPFAPPYDHSVPQHEAWANGWRQGQDALASAFQKKAAEEGEPAASVPPAEQQPEQAQPA